MHLPVLSAMLAVFAEISRLYRCHARKPFQVWSLRLFRCGCTPYAYCWEPGVSHKTYTLSVAPRSLRDWEHLHARLHTELGPARLSSA